MGRRRAASGADGKLLGIGSLLVQESVGGKTVDGNMFVPIDLLEPILDGSADDRPRRAPAARLARHVHAEMDGQLVVGGLAPGGPAERAGVQLGDLVLEVARRAASAGLAALFRRIWSSGPAGSEVPLTLSRRGAIVASAASGPPTATTS